MEDLVPGRIRDIDERECRALLGTTTVGRIAFVGPDGIVILPVNYTVHAGEVVFRTEPGTALAGLASGVEDVAFGVDFHDDLLGTGWSVMAKGPARELDAATAKELDEAGAPRPWAGGRRDVFIAVEPRRVSGRRVQRR